MDKFYIETLSEIETAINELEIEADYSIQRIEVIISIILKHLSDLKKNISKIRNLTASKKKFIFSNTRNL